LKPQDCFAKGLANLKQITLIYFDSSADEGLKIKKKKKKKKKKKDA